MTDKLPENGGYVAAAYLVFLALLLIYVAIMATRAGRLERELGDVLDIVQRDGAGEPGAGRQATGGSGPAEQRAPRGSEQ